MAHMFVILSLAVGLGQSHAVALAVPSAAIGQRDDSVCCNLVKGGKYSLAWTPKVDAAKTETRCTEVVKKQEQCNLPYVEQNYRGIFQRAFQNKLQEPVLKSLAERSAQNFLKLQNADPKPEKEREIATKAYQTALKHGRCCNVRDPLVKPAFDPLIFATWNPTLAYALEWRASATECPDAPDKGTRDAYDVAYEAAACMNAALEQEVQDRVMAKISGLKGVALEKRAEGVQMFLSGHYTSPKGSFDRKQSMNYVANTVAKSLPARTASALRSKEKMGVRPMNRLVRWAVRQLANALRI